MGEQHVRLYRSNLDNLLKLNGNACKVYTAILSFNPRPFPSFQKLCAMTGLSRSTVIRQINYLEERRHIEIIRNHGRVNHYKIMFEPVSVVTPPSVSGDTGTSVSGDTRTNTILSNTNIYKDFYGFLNTEIQRVSGDEVSLSDFEPDSVFLQICSNKFDKGFMSFIKRNAAQSIANEQTNRDRAEYLYGEVNQFIKEIRLKRGL